MSRRNFARQHLLRIVTAITVGGVITLLALETARRGYLRSVKFAEVPTEKLPTCIGFLFDDDAFPMVISSFAAGIIASLVCFVTSFHVGSKKPIGMFLYVNAVTAIFALFTAIVISALHIPSGH